MDNLKDILFENENVLWNEKPDFIAYIFRKTKKILYIAIAFLCLDFLLVGMAQKSIQFFPEIVISMLTRIFYLFLVPILIYIIRFVIAFLEYKNLIYAITDRRIILRTGIYSRDSHSINYADVSNVVVDASFFDKIRNAGSVIVYTSSRKGITFLAVKDPYAVYKVINETFMNVKSDIEFPNEYRPQSNPGYKTSLKK